MPTEKILFQNRGLPLFFTPPRLAKGHNFSVFFLRHPSLNQSSLVDNCEKEVICCCCGGVFSQNRLSSLHATLCHIPVLRQALRYERYKIIGQFGTLDNLAPLTICRKNNLAPDILAQRLFGIWHLNFI